MRVIDTKEYLDQVCAMLQEGQKSAAVPVAGTSMAPFLRPGDTVYLDLPERPLKKGDIVLFTRADGRYILHRICKCLPDGFLLLGDNQTQPEPVPAQRVRAIATGALRGGKPVKPGSLLWWFYGHVWLWLTPLRPKIAGLLHRVKK